MVRETSIGWPIIEKDYAISYLLAGIAGHPALAHTLILKGGTALKKLYFGDYRFSEDLDFSAVNSVQGDALEKSFRDALLITQQLLAEHGPFEFLLSRYTERDPHPGGQEAFIIHVRFPWHPTPLCRIKLEITYDEPVLLPPKQCRLLHGYNEPLTADIEAYQLDEIVAEKLRTLLQTNAMLISRGWHRPRGRDYYDLWRIVGSFREQLHPLEIQSCLDRKCPIRDVMYLTIDDFFTPLLVEDTMHAWESNLRTFVKNLPPCDSVLTELRSLLPVIVPRLSV